MQTLRQHNRFRRLILLVVALLISNIAMLSCAMAYAMCAEADCADHVPALCTDPCATTDVTLNDATGDATSDMYRPVTHAYASQPVDPTLRPEHAPVVGLDSTRHIPTPPLHLQCCVFLK